MAGLFYIEKACIHDRGRNFDPLIFKLNTHEELIQIQNEFVDELREANRSGTILKNKNYNPLKRS